MPGDDQRAGSHRIDHLQFDLDGSAIQVYGYHSAVRVRSATGGSPAIAKGHPLYNAAAAVFCLESARFICTTCSANTKVSVLQSVGFALAAQAEWTTSAIAAFIKAL